MDKLPLEYRSTTEADDDDAKPRVRWQTVVSCTLLVMGLLCGLAALAWPQRRDELVGAAVSLAVVGVIVYFPYVRT
jgi:hypothetical protein